MSDSTLRGRRLRFILQERTGIRRARLCAMTREALIMLGLYLVVLALVVTINVVWFGGSSIAIPQGHYTITYGFGLLVRFLAAFLSGFLFSNYGLFILDDSIIVTHQNGFHRYLNVYWMRFGGLLTLLFLLSAGWSLSVSLIALSIPIIWALAHCIPLLWAPVAYDRFPFESIESIRVSGLMASIRRPGSEDFLLLADFFPPFEALSKSGCLGTVRVDNLDVKS